MQHVIINWSNKYLYQIFRLCPSEIYITIIGYIHSIQTISLIRHNDLLSMPGKGKSCAPTCSSNWDSMSKVTLSTLATITSILIVFMPVWCNLGLFSGYLQSPRGAQRLISKYTESWVSIQHIRFVMIMILQGQYEPKVYCRRSICSLRFISILDVL